METNKKTSYKYCIVPKCKNTTIKTPNKLFFNVPREAKARQQWCNVMKRDKYKDEKLAVNSRLYCCEDHFNIQEDMENYMQYRIIGHVNIAKLKSGVTPSLFECQRLEPSTSIIRTGALKRRRIELVQEALLEAEAMKDVEIPGTSLQEELSFEPLAVPEVTKLKVDKCVQANLKLRKPSVRSKAVQVQTASREMGTSAIITPSENASTSPFKVELVKKALFMEEVVDEQSSATSVSSDSVYVVEENSSASESFEEALSNEMLQTNMRKCCLLSMEKQPKIFLGLPIESYYLIKMLVSNAPAPLLDILITIRKIRLNEPFAIVGVNFGMSASNASKIFRKTLLAIAKLLQQLIVWPDKKLMKLHLPISFRARYSNVVSIIDCLEIQIEKPSNPVHQSLTWSQYKGCNTLKYLISCTPDGLVNFISTGFGGRATDVTIVENCGYLDKLSPGVSVMADRGFKNIAHLLEEKSCILVRPPSVLTGKASTKQEVKESKRIAALRIHVERVIGRLREFNMLLPHACVDNHHISLLDNIIIVACAIINLQ